MVQPALKVFKGKLALQEKPGKGVLLVFRAQQENKDCGVSRVILAHGANKVTWVQLVSQGLVA
jgi:hypothetical protein